MVWVFQKSMLESAHAFTNNTQPGHKFAHHIVNPQLVLAAGCRTNLNPLAAAPNRHIHKYP